MVYAKIIQVTSDEVRMSVKCVSGETEDFTGDVGVHPGLALSPYLFSLVIDKPTKKIQDEAFLCMIFAEDMVLGDENKNVLEGELERRRENL